jgi:hypothetical protein
VGVVAKKKPRFRLQVKLNKKQKALAWRVGTPIAVGLVCLLVGIIATHVVLARKQPANVVWAADNTVKIPADLKNFLLHQTDCKNYRGTSSPQGVGLWGVYQVSKDKFAKISYGCSISLSNYIMAVKQNGTWQLLQPTEYFSPFANTQTAGALPLCAQLDKYKIDQTIESFCVDATGAAKANQN